MPPTASPFQTQTLLRPRGRLCRPVEPFVDVYRGRVARDGTILDKEVEAPTELPDETPNVVAVMVMAASDLFSAGDARSLRQRWRLLTGTSTGSQMVPPE